MRLGNGFIESCRLESVLMTGNGFQSETEPVADYIRHMKDIADNLMIVAEVAVGLQEETPPPYRAGYDPITPYYLTIDTGDRAPRAYRARRMCPVLPLDDEEPPLG
eukprot:CAMPEP_0184667186 /NCGR_PEP_ID=MMETSP0308-20130426/65888_1 /TAXON_ID=38269 /ORGANISM="Gloeochaete witrockiana, Strain SAG 46.84" /LENGTH=105 /DNA_ID=CAMNT_0027112231 /DNA_START=659 /DNA_END=971 /DNA_ORIENTATION=-